MVLSMCCPPCGQTFSAESEDELVALVQVHTREEHGRNAPADEILEEAVVTS
jgi:predicted small metal-binding protein